MEKDVRILERKEVFRRAIFAIEEARLQYRRPGGDMSAEQVRLVLNRGDSAAILLHDGARGRVLLCEQFRFPTYGPGSGWLLEIPAGIVDRDETPEAAARREAREETGLELHDLRKIACVYPSPGGTSERIHVFHAGVALENLPASGGLGGEGEDIRLVPMTTREALAMARDGRISDAKTLIALQWLELNEGVLAGSNVTRPGR